MKLFRPQAANKGKRRTRTSRPRPLGRIVSGDIASHGTSHELVADEMAAQRSMQERGRRLMRAIARGLQRHHGSQRHQEPA